MLNNIIKNKKGVTLLELMVAVAVFSVVIIMATSIFSVASEGQLNAIAAQNIQESMRFAYESLSKEMRTAVGYQEGNDCGTPLIFKVYNTDTGDKNGTELFFENQEGECVHYRLESDGGINRFKITRSKGGDTKTFYITPDEISITGLEFYVQDDEVETFHSTQPKITMKMEVEMAGGKKRHKQNMILHTSVSSRSYHLQ